MNVRALNVKQFGLKRWQWLVLISAGVLFGLYLRSRQAKGEVEQEETGQEPAPIYEDTIAANADEPGLAGVAGTFGPPAGSVIPVQAPLVPEGYPETAQIGGDIAGSLVGTLGDVAVAALERQPSEGPVPAVNITLPGQRPPRNAPHKKKPQRHPGGKKGHSTTGGGPPRGRGKHKPGKPKHPKPTAHQTKPPAKHRRR